MFGIIYAIGMAVGTIVSGTKCAIEEQHQISKAEQKKKEGKNKYNLYTDRKGATRDLDTKELRTMDYIGCESEGKDQYIRDIYGNPVRNLSAERRFQRIEEAQKDSRRTVSLWKESIQKSKLGRDGNPYYSGKQYKDLQNGKIYVCRHLRFPSCINKSGGAGAYYMDVTNGLLVRETDSQIFERSKGLYEYSKEMNDQFIEYFNKKQREGGYSSFARRRSYSGWNQEESPMQKEMRLDAFYCNNNEWVDEPIRRFI